MPTLDSSSASPLPSRHTDEAFLNKSLLDQLDAQADAEPSLRASDSDIIPAPSYASSSASGSPSIPYHLNMQSQQQQQPRSDSPSDINANSATLHHIHQQDSMYSIHNQQNGMYNTGAIHDYPSELDAQKQSHKINGYPNNNSYRSSFTSFPNTTRQRHGTTPSTNAPSYRDPSFFPQSGDVFAPQMTSPTQAHMQPAYDPRASYDFGVVNGGRMMEFAQQPNQKPSYPSSSATFGGVHMSSQTPYGPHVPSAVNGMMGVNMNINGNGNGVAGLNMNGVSSNPGQQEDISTIFVVGFPDDMQVR